MPLLLLFTVAVPGLRDLCTYRCLFSGVSQLLKKKTRTSAQTYRYFLVLLADRWLACIL